MDTPEPQLELALVDLRDRRLNRRAQRLVEAIGRQPAAGFPTIFRDPSELEAFYRFVNNDSVSAGALLAPHRTEGWLRAQRFGPTVLVAHDTSEFKFAGDAEREGLGASGVKQSFHGHFALAVAEGEAPVVHGVVGWRAYVVEDGAWYEATEQRETEELIVGSHRWSDLTTEVREQAPPGVHLVHVMDREADDYALWTHVVEQGDDFVIRAQHDRALVGTTSRTSAVLSDQTFTVQRDVRLSRRGHRRPPASKKTHPPREVRAARLSVRAGTIEVRRPKDVVPLGRPTMTLSIVEVVELAPPDGEVPVRWLLLSTLPCGTEEQVCRIIDIYRKRWLIEEYFKALKTGCSAEKRQGRSLWSLLAMLGLLVPIAWRLLAIRAMARHDPEAPAGELLDEVELQALRHLAPRARLPVAPSRGQVLLAVARLGGHLRSNGEPGWQVLGRGLETLLQFAAGWRAALHAMKSAHSGLAAGEDEM